MKLRHGDIVKGSQKCDKPDCGEMFKWVFLYWAPRSSEVVMLPNLKTDENSLTKIDDTHASCYCHHCGRKNFFELDFKNLKK